jgi:hypothetical protein
MQQLARGLFIGQGAVYIEQVDQTNPT